MNRTEKQELVSKLTETIHAGKGVYLADFTGLNVEKVSDLRRQLRRAGVHVEVAKNTLLRLAVKGGEYDVLLPHLSGPTAILIPNEEEIAPAKILDAFIKEHKLPQVKLACLDGKIYQEKEVQELAKLPPRDTLMAMLLGAFHAPLSQLVGVMKAPLRELASVLDEVAKKRGE